LFATADYLPGDELAIVIGGDNLDDPPLTKYFPELQQASVQDEIKRTGTSS
jgi:hypothetical protein